MSKQPILPPGPPDFPFAWEEPADAELSWEFDNMHCPTALAPLAADYLQAIAQGFEYRYFRLDQPIQILARVWNGYGYFGVRFGVPEADRPAMFERVIDARRRLIATTADYWTGRAIPELRESYAAVDAVDVQGMEPERLAAAWDAAWERIYRAWRIHFFVITGAYQALDDLAERYEALVPGAPPGDALRLIQGNVTELQDVGEGLEQLTDLAADDPATAAWLRDGAHGDPPAETPFAVALDDYLDRHGHLGQGWDDLQLASWREEPRRLLSDVAKRLDQPSERAADRRRRLAEEAEALHQELRARLADRPEELAEFEELLGHARDIGPITETHNYWIDRMAQACLRRFVVRIGHRLVALGAFDRADDVFYLRKTEVRDLLGDPQDRTELIERRRLEHARQRRITPPRWVGMPPDEGGSGRFETPEAIAQVPDEVRGVGASAGVARGPARVALGEADFDRIQRGDVIVCPSSNPSWVPLFSIAAGLVTDTGGVLSHAAVVAREFGLPAVVGTRDATTRIADGRMVEVDGATGIVRLL
ncbi:MAG: PEP-utilizing enzyme [Candidatus Limnocylindria bacterium]